VGKPRANRPFARLGIDGIIILKYIINYGVTWAGYIRLRTGTGDWLL
jgi:hypothetical protein